MATLEPQDPTWFKVMENMGAEWKKTSKGSINLVIHAGGVLGDEPECGRHLDHRSIQVAPIAQLTCDFATIPGASRSAGASHQV